MLECMSFVYIRSLQPNIWEVTHFELANLNYLGSILNVIYPGKLEDLKK